MPDKLIPFCKLDKNTRTMTIKRYFVGTLSFTSKLLIVQNEDAKEGEPGWTTYFAEREPKPQPGDYGDVTGGDYPTGRRKVA